MKKQIAILATMLAASGFSAFGQDWLLLSTGANLHQIWDETTTPGSGIAGSTGEYDVSFLWAATGTSDPLSNIGTQLTSTGETPTAQVATNGVTSTGSALSTIQTMLGAGWSIATDINSGSGSAATSANSPAFTTTGTSGKITAFNGGDAFELGGASFPSSSQFQIEVVVIAWNASATLGSGATTFSSVADFGYTSPVNDTVGSNASDPNNGPALNTLTYNSFGVAPAAVPEPTTLALAGLGGLSMLFLRRRKA